MKKENIPNYLSTFRIFLVAILVTFVFCEFSHHYIFAAFTYLIAGFTDILDGYLARRNKWCTNIGRILDPLADKLLQIAVLVCFAIKHILPFWLIIPFILKEMALLVLGLLMIQKRGVFVKSRWYGKAAALLMCVAAVFVLLVADLANKIVWYINAIYIFVLGFTILAIILYIFEYINVHSEEDIKN